MGNGRERPFYVGVKKLSAVISLRVAVNTLPLPAPSLNFTSESIKFVDISIRRSIEMFERKYTGGTYIYYMLICIYLRSRIRSTK